MARPINLTDEQIESTVTEFRTKIKSAKLERGEFKFTKLFQFVNRKATLILSELAWLKMTALVNSYSTEVGWHGLARRTQKEDDDIYFVYDVLIPPQQVNGTKVDTDPDEYNEWLEGLPDDVFNDLHFQGHSHVSMSTTPSSTDTAEYIDIVKRIKTDSFYIFGIFNKKGEKNLQIYDLKKNIMFDTSDITMQVLDGDIGIMGMLREAEKLVTEKKYIAPVYGNYGSAYTGGYSSGYGGYNGGYSGANKNAGTYTTGKNSAGKQAPASTGKKDKVKSDKKKDKKVDNPDDDPVGWVEENGITVDIAIDDGKELTPVDCTRWSGEGISINYIMETYGFSDDKFRAMLDLITIDPKYHNTELRYLPKLIGVSETMEHSIAIVIDMSVDDKQSQSDYSGIDDDDLDDPLGPFGWKDRWE